MTDTFTPTDTPTFPVTITITPTGTPTNTGTPTVTPTPINSGVVSTLAGSVKITGSTNGNGTAALFYVPTGVAVDTFGNVYVADQDNDLVREILSGGAVTTLAGQAGVIGATNATGTAASFFLPTGVAVDSSGTVYVADQGNDLIREIAPGGAVSTLAGSVSVSGSANGPAAIARFNLPVGVAVDFSGNVYVADFGNNMIRKIFPGGEVTTLAGSAGVTGTANGTGSAALFNEPIGVAVDSSGNVYVGDHGNHLVRKITSGGIVTTLAGSGSAGGLNGTGTGASFYGPNGVAVDSTGNVYVADGVLIRVISPGGVVSTLAGSGSAGSANGTGAAASFNGAEGIAVNFSGKTVFVADEGNELIREIQ